jgi:hypothetical protein
MKHNWNEDGWQLTKDTGGVGLPRTDYFKLFAKVWLKSATAEIAQNGFRSTGLFPLNPGAIPDSEFAPSMTTDRVMLPPTLPGPSTNVDLPQSSGSTEEPIPCQANLDHVEVPSPVLELSVNNICDMVSDMPGHAVTFSDQLSAPGCHGVNLSSSQVSMHGQL